MNPKIEVEYLNLKPARIHFKKFPNYKITVKPWKFGNVIFKRPFIYWVNKEFSDNYSLGIPLGAGQSCLVRRCWPHDKENHQKAVKQLDQKYFQEYLHQI